MLFDGKIYLAKGDTKLFLLPGLANRHGLIAGATGTGKTVTMKVLAEGFSALGVPVFLCDVKGDLSGTCMQGRLSDSVSKRLASLGIEEEEFALKAFPTRFWDVFGERGTPVRVTVSELGPTLLSRMLDLTEIQTGCLNIVFRVADDHDLPLLDLKDLRSMVKYVAENRKEFTEEYGLVSSASLGAIQRALLSFEEEGGDILLGEPSFEIKDWIRTDTDGRGYINILSSDKIINTPRVYAAFLLWLLSELYEKLPEIGDPEKPRLVFFFDEAHFLFEDAPKALTQKLEQVVRLIRSKGIGVYFVTQSPSDIPDIILSQLSNRVQHGLRAYTPSEQKAIKAAAQAFRKKPGFDTEEALSSLGTGEALISFLNAEGIPSIVEKAVVLPPQSLLGPAEGTELAKRIAADEFDLKYRERADRESAYEIIKQANAILEEEAEAQAEQKAAEKRKAGQKKSNKGKKSTARKAADSAVNTVTRAVSMNLINSLTGGKKTGASAIAKRAAANALSSVMRSASSGVFRGIFGTKK